VTSVSPLLALPLEGVRALEASAGTGKTFAITKLYLRLLLERGLRVEQILVVTYTIAATQELRSRIRRELLAALRVLEQHTLPDPPDATLLSLLASTAQDEERRRQAVTTLRLAIATLDQAAIHTIHGFCQRVLGEQAFESAEPFVAVVDPDGWSWVQAVVEDAWRRAMQGGPGWVGYLLDKERGPEHLARTLALYILRRDLHVRAPSEAVDSAAEEAEVLVAWQACRAFPPAALNEVQRLLDGPAVNQARLRPDKVAAAIAVLRDGGEMSWPDATVASAVAYLRASRVLAAGRKGKPPPRHSVLDACERLACALDRAATAFARRRAALRRHILATAPEELRRRKREQAVLTFDDLLLHVDDALHRPQGGEALAATIRNRWRVALVDEFQDTDPVQYRIFRRIWGAAGSALFLVGDPKQAIYGFRGADVYAYLQAQQEVQDRWGLAVNHRSDPGLVQAVNTLFARVQAPFVVPGIVFTPVAPADAARPAGMRVRGEPLPPLRLWFVDRDEGQGTVTKSDARPRIAAAVAGEIAALLQAANRGEAVIRAGEPEWRPLAGGDLAVLVASHREAQLVRRALLERGVASVLHSRESVLATPEADALRLVLAAVAEPGREGLVRAAIGTDLLGMPGEQLDALARDEAEWERIVQRFRAAHDAFREHGVAYMLRRLFAEWNVPARLLPFVDGERRLTNVLHIAELLSAEAARRPIGLDGLIAWMAARAAEEPPDGDERQLRLESDEHLVKIVTIHKSKGLEYPLVFVPFAWDGTPRAPVDDYAAYHDPERGWCLTLDLGPEIADEVREQVRREELAERMRLLYVALTRARHGCVVVWGGMRGAGSSALGWLLHPPAADLPMSQAARRFDGVSDAQLRADLEQLAAAAPGSIVVEPLPAGGLAEVRGQDGEEETLSARAFGGRVPEGWRVASFTLLASGLGPGDEADRDDGPRAPLRERQPPGDDPLHLPGGARVGTALHEVFERAELATATRDELEALAAERLTANGEDPQWARALATAVARTLETPLDPARRLWLRRLDRAARLHEMEFTYPIARFDAAGVRERCQRHGFGKGAIGEAIARFDGRALRGFMRGFIDLVFAQDGRWWLVDWKSTWLGPEPQDYARERLETVIARENYWLQYLIYTLAVHRLLRRRVPGYDYERHFGGVFYVFVRGVDPAQGCRRGIFDDRLPAGLVSDLDAWFG